jgi:leucyl/phenylalanyl-tRNA--protein transferase
MAMLSPDTLIRAYAQGLFPMAERHDDPTLFWIDPEKRGIIPLNSFHIPRRLKRSVRKKIYEIRINTSFEEVIRTCAAPTNSRKETWINDEIINLYVDLFKMGRAHSVEAWKDNLLVGGLYGVAIGGAFFGESMFSRARDSSKVALVHLVAKLKFSGFKLLDTQFVTGHLAQFGVVEIHRSGYHHLLSSALDARADFLTELPDDALEELMQSTTVTS